eukprot:TRINITY_DN20912_c0_g1_i1.p1 TRINITY_DN20912_c0_g1~~TRINITY_DN20912_c0_g1_i1.p1  ORF type:complete len:500 (-),score=37.02 TRINITY_DN20912_c0_g1_i1:10-1509(-)
MPLSAQCAAPWALLLLLTALHLHGRLVPTEPKLRAIQVAPTNPVTPLAPTVDPVSRGLHHTTALTAEHAELLQDWVAQQDYPVIPVFQPRTYPVRTDPRPCEALVQRVLTNPTVIRPQPRWDPHPLPSHVCGFYRRVVGMKVCRSSGERSAVFHMMGMYGGAKHGIAKPQAFLSSFREQVEPFLLRNGTHAVFSIIHIPSNVGNDTTCRPSDCRNAAVILQYTDGAVDSYQRVYGRPPLLIASDEHTQRILAARGYRSVLDTTPLWRGADGVNDWLRISRTPYAKYLFTYLLLCLGYTTTYFDIDGFWLQPMELPPHGEYDIIARTETEPPSHPRRSEFVQQGFYRAVFSGPILGWFTWCEPELSHIPITGGFFTAYSTRYTHRFFAAFLDTLVHVSDFWWEQNLWAYMLPQFTSFGLRLGLYSGVVTSVNSIVTARLCMEAKWVHTKQVATGLALCRKVLQNPSAARQRAHVAGSDVYAANITLDLEEQIALSQRYRG